MGGCTEPRSPGVLLSTQPPLGWEQPERGGQEGEAGTPTSSSPLTQAVTPAEDPIKQMRPVGPHSRAPTSLSHCQHQSQTVC